MQTQTSVHMDISFTLPIIKVMNSAEPRGEPHHGYNRRTDRRTKLQISNSDDATALPVANFDASLCSFHVFCYIVSLSNGWIITVRKY